MLGLLAFLIAVYGGSIAIGLPMLGQEGRSAGSVLVAKATIALLTLVLALLVGMEFPLANRLVFDGTERTASRLYTADFVGASLGALLASTLLLPAVGVAGVCALTAGLNLLAGLGILLRKSAI